jgi:hypothetical protein
MKRNLFHIREQQFLRIEHAFLEKLNNKSLNLAWTRIREEIIDSTIISSLHTNQSTYKSRLYDKLFKLIKLFTVFPVLIYRLFNINHDKNIDILVFGSGRVDNLKSEFWDIQISPYLCELSQYKYVVFEPSLLNKSNNAKVYDFSLIKLCVSIFSFFILPLVFFKVYLHKEVIDFEKSIRRDFKKNINLRIQLAISYSIRKSEILIYRFFFRFVFKPNLLLYSSLGTPIVLIEVAKSKGIKTVEIQHGMLNYNYMFGYPNTTFCPDYFFSWSKFFTEIIVKTVSQIVPVTIGNISLANYISVNQSNLKGWAFVSQGNKRLVKLLKNFLDKHNSDSGDIYFLPRPNEIQDFNILYPEIYELELQGKVIVKRDYTNSLNFISKVNHVVGVSSTLLFEALCLSKIVFVLEDHEWPSITKQIPEDNFYILNNDFELLNNPSFDKLCDNDIMPPNPNNLFRIKINEILNE